MNKDNYLGRLPVLFLLTLLFCGGSYFLPDTLFGFYLKKIDLLSDLRLKETSETMDSLRMQLEKQETLTVDTAAVRDSILTVGSIDSLNLALRDSFFVAKRMQTEEYLKEVVEIEDFSIGHIALKRFFSALRNVNKLDRPVRIAFLGDSFIEGDIVVADLRSAMQKKFGGRGIGFIPVASVSSQYRPTIQTKEQGWSTRSLLTQTKHKYMLSGMLFEPKEERALFSFKATGFYPELKKASSLKFYYVCSEDMRMQLVCEGDTIDQGLPSSHTIGQYEWNGEVSEAKFSFFQARGLQALGVAWEDNRGVVVDNYSLRGNSGTSLNHLDTLFCQEYNAIRPYDLIILQYGLNVANDDVLQYGWYAKKMEEVVRHIQRCFPDADVLLMGVSDRSRMVEGAFETMPAVLALLHSQRQIARRTGIAFWNTFEAMGGENSMVNFVRNNWASKDYTHIGFRGGKEIAKVLFEAMLIEKEFYDEAEELVD